MTPVFSFGLYAVDLSLRLVIERVFGNSHQLFTLDTEKEVESFLSGISFPHWRILVADCEQLVKAEPLLTSLQERYLKIKTFHLVLWTGENQVNAIQLFGGRENVHIVGAG